MEAEIAACHSRDWAATRQEGGGGGASGRAMADITPWERILNRDRFLMVVCRPGP